jgi:hypothetical protein
VPSAFLDEFHDGLLASTPLQPGPGLNKSFMSNGGNCGGGEGAPPPNSFLLESYLDRRMCLTIAMDATFGLGYWIRDILCTLI